MSISTGSKSAEAIDQSVIKDQQNYLNAMQDAPAIRLDAEFYQADDIDSTGEGLIKNITVSTIGGVVAPGQTLMEIVPLDRPMIVDIRISPRHIGHIAVGLPVQVKISSFDYARYGAIEGELEYISASTFQSENGERYYRGRVKLSQNHVGTDPGKNIIVPGMTVMADIVTGDKTIMQYLLKPIQNSLQTAMTER